MSLNIEKAFLETIKIQRHILKLKSILHPFNNLFNKHRHSCNATQNCISPGTYILYLVYSI